MRKNIIIYEFIIILLSGLVRIVKKPNQQPKKSSLAVASGSFLKLTAKSLIIPNKGHRH